MEKKVIKLFLIIQFLIFSISCNTSKHTQNSIYGKWVDIENKNLKIIIDSLANQLTIDYTALGGKIFNSTYKVNSNNEITSNILTKGAKVEFDKNGYMKFYPIQKEYTKDIESIYTLKFKRVN
jgi:hypothetical protein